MKKRKDCFFGVHFDFHSNQTALGIGEKLEESKIQEFLRTVKPDFVQCDVKGHGGYSSYPTKCGFQTPAIKKDILAIWRNVTKQENVALYAHYSGILDAIQAKINPDWCVCDKNGNTDPYAMSSFSDYDENILIPQLIELAVDYKLDGAWVDGECWAATEDYSAPALLAYEKSGKVFSFKDFHRQAFRNHVQNYLNKVREVAPNFEIASNWMYTQQMPEKPTVSIDFISGDVIPMETYNATKFGTRVIANQNKTWDLASWSTDFYLHYEKSALQLCTEAADIIAMGGAFQVYCVQDYKSFMQNETYIPTLKEIGEFCKARQEFCHHANIRKEVGVLISEKGYFCERDRLFGRGGIHTDSASGLTVACLENQYSTEILLGYNALEQDISGYKAIIIPELKEIEPELKQKLLSYAKAGGALIIIGAHSSKLFASEFGYGNQSLKTDEVIAQLIIDNKKLTVECDFTLFNGDSLHQAKLATTSGEGLGVKQSVFGGAGGSWPLPRVQFDTSVVGSMVKPYGKGNIAIVPFDLGEQYLNFKTYQMRDMLGEIISKCYTEKMVKTNTHLVEIVLTEKNGREFINLINLGIGKVAGEVKTYDESLPIHNLKVEYLRDKKPSKVILLPENKELEFSYNNGRVCFEIEKLDIHSIIEIID
ncbi:MAG: hypothetical protein IKJ19_03815 [Clostridia bacterium]|nr:hypothetical protein [Clostridia bacterium]